MTCTQMLLLEMIRQRIHLNTGVVFPNDGVAFVDLMNEANRQGVALFVMDILKPDMISDDDQDVYVAHQKLELLRAMQFRDIESRSYDFLKVLEGKSIPYALLKGIGHKVFYTNPSTRIYGDIDILVGPQDMDDVDKIFLLQGYSRVSAKDESYHITYQKKGAIPVEVHYKVSPIVGVGGRNVCTEELLSTVVEAAFEDLTFTVLGKEERIVYNMMHLSKHVNYEGFGFRQLIDMHYLLSVKGIQWEKVYSLAKAYGIRSFVDYIITIFERYFYMDYYVDGLGEIDENIYNVFSSFIADSGLYGHDDVTHYTDALLSKYAVESDLKSGKKWRYIMTMLFPNGEMLPVKYKYAKKNGILLPFAWVHRLLFELRSNPERIKKVLKADPHIESMERHYRLREAFGLVREE